MYRLDRKNSAETLRRITQLEVGAAGVKRGVDTLVTETVFRWLAAPDPASNHEAAQKKREPETGLWLTGHSDYKNGKTETVRCFGSMEIVSSFTLLLLLSRY